MNENHERILAMVEDGKISAEEGERLLLSLRTGEGAGNGAEAKAAGSERPAAERRMQEHSFSGIGGEILSGLSHVGQRIRAAVQPAADPRAKQVTLTPSQQKAFDGLSYALDVSAITALWTNDGLGRSTILRKLHAERGGVLVSMKEVAEALADRHPLQFEEAFELVVRDAMASHDLVIVDDLSLLLNAVSPCGNYHYPRSNWLDSVLTNLTQDAESAGKRLLFGCDQQIPSPISCRCYSFGIDKLEQEDYATLCRAYLPESVADELDIAKIHRFAPRLTAHQIKSACVWVRREGVVTTDRYIEYLRSQRMASNVDLGEVEEVELHDLKGVDDLIEALEANIILPLENDALATELGIKPKRGVLLAGPPGTGKTTVGRALAHRLRSKFFLIDGTIISGAQNFYPRIMHIFELAKQNAPCIIFLDDSDVMFQSGEELGLYRYLLTMLDGLESETAGRICVMMTAMNVANLPPALVRSGRIELWLETRLPDEAARLAIMKQRFAGLPASIGEVDLEALAAETDGLTGADLKRLVDDGKILYAYDRSRGLPLQPATEYFRRAIETVRENNARYAEAEARAAQQKPQQNPMEYFASMAAMAAAGECDMTEGVPMGVFVGR